MRRGQPRPGVRSVCTKSCCGDAVSHRSHVVFLSTDDCLEQRLVEVGRSRGAEDHVVARTVLMLFPAGARIADRLAVGFDQHDVGGRVAIGEVCVRDVHLLGGRALRVAGVLSVLGQDGCHHGVICWSPVRPGHIGGGQIHLHGIDRNGVVQVCSRSISDLRRSVRFGG